ncbi:lactadherin-like [Amphiura filiformis]|uniref:lactadherin-like n=1 Tax=Amphiura filiformis TaxID=82378 RepID=UPI003B223F9A
MTGKQYFGATVLYLLSDGSLSPAPSPLGLEDRSITDHQITASSFYSSTLTPFAGRLNDADYWAARVGESNPWLQVDFETTVIIMGIQIQGAGRIEQWVTDIQVEFGTEESALTPIEESGVILNFPANFNSEGTKHLKFPHRLVARYLRIIVKDYIRHPAMRLEVMGYRCM